MAITPLGVITEFKFEVGAALLGVKSLTNATDSLQDSVDGALESSKNLGIAFAANLGFGGGSLLGLASTAIQTSEAFDEVSRSFATIISANKEKLTGTINTFNDRLKVSSVIIKDIVKDARKFGLDEKSLVSQTKLLSAALAPKGLAGKNFEVPRELSRNLLKAAPLLGVDPSQTEGQLLRLIGGQASLGDTLFRRLTSETSAFGDFNKKGGSKSFNALDAAKRIDILRAGLSQFTSDTDVLDARLTSLNNQFVIFKQTVSGIDGILRPLGEALKKPLVKAMQFINKQMNTTGRQIVANFSAAMEQLLSSPRNLLINILQLRKASEDLRRTSAGLERAGLSGIIALVANKLVKLPAIFIKLSAGISFAGSVLEKISSGIVPDFVKKMISTGTMILAVTAAVGGILIKFGLIGSALTFLGSVFSVIIAPAIALFGVMQLISRAIAIARIKDAALLPSLLLKTSEAMRRVTDAGFEILGVLNAFFNSIAESIAPMFSAQVSANGFVTVLNLMAGAMESIRDTVLIVSATFHGLANSIASLGVIMQDTFAFLFNGTIGGAATEIPGPLDAFDQGFEEFLARAMKPQKDGGQALVNANTTINGGITIKNEFKENQEPDRIAFTIKDQLMKAAQNPTGASGFALSTGLVGG